MLCVLKNWMKSINYVILNLRLFISACMGITRSEDCFPSSPSTPLSQFNTIFVTPPSKNCSWRLENGLSWRMELGSFSLGSLWFNGFESLFCKLVSSFAIWISIFFSDGFISQGLGSELGSLKGLALYRPSEKLELFSEGISDSLGLFSDPLGFVPVALGVVSGILGFVCLGLLSVSLGFVSGLTEKADWANKPPVSLSILCSLSLMNWK